MSLFKDTQILATVAATSAQTAAQWLLNAAMDANPVMLVVIAVAALVAVVILAYTHVAVFRDTVNAMGTIVVGVFHDVVGAAQMVFGWIASNWPLLLAILGGPFGLAALFELTENWGDVGRVLLGGLPGKRGVHRSAACGTGSCRRSVRL